MSPGFTAKHGNTTIDKGSRECDSQVVFLPETSDSARFRNAKLNPGRRSFAVGTFGMENLFRKEKE